LEPQQRGAQARRGRIRSARGHHSRHIGVETTFGRNIGTFRVIDALSTLAFDYPKRSAYFRGELEHYLVFSREQKIDPLRVKGRTRGRSASPSSCPGRTALRG